MRRPADDIQATCDSLGFEKLKIVSVEGGKDEDEGYVTFQVGGVWVWVLWYHWLIGWDAGRVGMLLAVGMLPTPSSICAMPHMLAGLV